MSVINLDTRLSPSTELDHQNIFINNIYDVSALGEVIRTPDIYEGFEKYCMELIPKLLKLSDEKFNSAEMKNMNYHDYTVLGLQVLGNISDKFYMYKDLKKYTQEEAYKALRDTYLPRFENNKNKRSNVLSWCESKIRYNKKIISSLARILMMNHRYFSITYDQAQRIVNKLLVNDNEEFKSVFNKKKDQFLTNNLLTFDGRKIGLGCICFSQDVYNKVDSLHRSWYESILNGSITECLYTYLTNFDITIISHGSRDESGNWILEPISTPNGKKEYDKMEPYLRALVSEGFRRINIVVCNPDNVSISSELVQDRNLEIFIHNNKTLIS